MLNTIIYISDNYNNFRNSSLEKYKSGITLSFLIKSSNSKNIVETYQFFSNNISPQFSLTIIINAPFDDIFLYNIISFFFLPGYQKINNQFIINLIYENDDILNDVQRDLIKISNNQGIKNLHINWLIPEQSHASINAQQSSTRLYSNINNFMLLYTHTLQSSTFYNNLFYVDHVAIEVDKLHSLITNANDTIKINNSFLYEVVLKLQILAIENSNLKLKNQSFVNELENYKTHIEVLKSVHEATELQLYYDNEYEILPIWYKRLGHILKFLMGKRNFKSLFNNK